MAAPCAKSSLYFVGFATLKLTGEITLVVAPLPHRLQITCCFVGSPLPAKDLGNSLALFTLKLEERHCLLENFPLNTARRTKI